MRKSLFFSSFRRFIPLLSHTSHYQTSLFAAVLFSFLILAVKPCSADESITVTVAYGNSYTLYVTGEPTFTEGDTIYVCSGNDYNFNIVPHTVGTWTAYASPASGTITPDGSQTTINISTITYTPGTDEPACESEFSVEVSVGVVKVEMKLELEGNEGKIIIDPSNNYSENAKIRVTAVNAADGEICEWFYGSVQISEDGTTIYSQNTELGAILPASVDITSGGTTTFIAKSISEAKREWLEKPDPAKIKTTNYDVYGGESLSVPQWVDNNGNSRIDWCEQWSNAILSAAKMNLGEIGDVAFWAGYFGSDTYDIGKYGSSNHPPVYGWVIYINPAATGHRTNHEKRLTETILHECRHLYQFSQTETSPPGAVDNDHDPIDDPDNDDDPGFWWEQDGDELYEIGKYPSERIVLDWPPWKGDGIKDPEEMVLEALEFDANEFAFKNKNNL